MYSREYGNVTGEWQGDREEGKYRLPCFSDRLTRPVISYTIVTHYNTERENVWKGFQYVYECLQL